MRTGTAPAGTLAAAPRRRRRWALTGAVSILALTALPTLAQEGEGGRFLTFGLSQSLEYDRNLRLDSASAGATTQALTALSAGLVTETRLDRLRLDASTRLRIADGPATDGVETELADPRFALSYNRAGARAGFSTNLGYTQSDIAYLRPLSDFLDEDGVLDLPDDLDDLSGEGIRTSLNYGVTLRLGEGGPLGTTISASQSRLSYRDATNPELVDNTRTNLGLGFRLLLSSVTTATIDLGASRFEEEGAEDRDTYSLSAGVSHARPLGEISLSASASDTPDGRSSGLSFGRSFDLPTGGVNLRLGLSRGTSGETDVVGGLSLSHQYGPDGRITAGLSRALTTGSDDSEELVTSLTLGLAQDLGDIGSLTASALWAETRDSADGTTSDRAELALGFNRPLTQDWVMGVTLRHEIEEDARNTGLSLTLGRSFTLPF